MSGLLDQLQNRVRNGDYEFTAHASNRLIKRGLFARDIEDAVLSGEAEIIEEYPDDVRGASCLVLGFDSGGRPIHVQFSYPPGVAIITAYEPDLEKWVDFRIRRREQT